jgi:hypothetical protein
MYAIILATLLGIFGGGTLGYFLGRYQSQLVHKIRTLEGQAREEPKPEPEKPTVTAGAYAPPREVSTSIDKKQGAGLVETKTPERLDWENSNELAELEHSR